MEFVQDLRNKINRYPNLKLLLEIIFVIIPIAFLIRTFIFGLYQVPTGSMEPTLLVGERFIADKLSYWIRDPRRGEIIAFNDPRYDYPENVFQGLWHKYASWNVMNWTKRVIGLPGERVQGKIEDGKPVIYINGKQFNEPYVSKYPLIAIRTKSLDYLNYDYNKYHSYGNISLRAFDPKLPWSEQPFYKINPQDIVRNAAGVPAEILYPGHPVREGIDVFDVTLDKDEYWVMGDNRLNSGDSRVSEFGPLKRDKIHARILFRLWSMDTQESWLLLDLIKNPINFWKKVRWNRCLEWVK